MCYHCMPDIATQRLCNMMSQYTRETCTNENATCYMSSMSVSNMSVSNMSMVFKTYYLGCTNVTVSKDNPLHTALYSLSEGGGVMCRWTILFFTFLS